MKQESLKLLKALRKDSKNSLLAAALDSYSDSIEDGLDGIELMLDYNSGIIACDDSEDLFVHLIHRLVEDLEEANKKVKTLKRNAEYSSRKEL